jgi:hypothetical protein
MPEEPAFREHAHLLGAVTDVQTRSGLIALVVRAARDGALTASAGGFEITLDADNRMHAV